MSIDALVIPMKSRILKQSFKIVGVSYLLLLCFITTFSSVTLASTGKYSANDFDHWLKAAYIAEATYGSRKILERLFGKKGFDLTKSQKIKGYAVTYFLATNEKTKQHILAVRGTANIENMLVNATFVLVHDNLTNIDIHQGFLLSARDIYQQIKPLLKPGYTITTIGHSLGGATALVIAMMLDAQGYPVDEIITFGQPKVTNMGGSRKFEHLNVTRIVTVKDMIPLVPPIDPMNMMKLSIFWHQGTEIVLYNDTRYSVLSGINSMLRATDFLNDIPDDRHFNNHFMSTYISYLKEKLEAPEQVKFENDFKFSDWLGTK